MAHGCICDHCGAYTSESHGDEEYELLCEGCYAELGDDEDGIGNAYDDEAGRGYAENTRGEELAQTWPSEWKASSAAADRRSGRAPS